MAATAAIRVRLAMDENIYVYMVLLAALMNIALQYNNFTSIVLTIPYNSWTLSAHPGQVAAPQSSAGRFRSLPVGSIRNPNRRRSIDSKYALDGCAVSRLSFQLWTSKPRIWTS